ARTPIAEPSAPSAPVVLPPPIPALEPIMAPAVDAPALTDEHAPPTDADFFSLNAEADPEVMGTSAVLIGSLPASPEEFTLDFDAHQPSPAPVVVAAPM